jgi:hypothetical protein
VSSKSDEKVKHFAIFDISYFTRISQITQMLLADGERLPQAENLRNLRNLCDAKSTLILSAIKWKALFSSKKWRAIRFNQQKISSYFRKA